MILFITRKFPPSRGGMERVAYELSQQLSKMANIKLVAWRGTNKWLPLVLPCLFFKALWFSILKNVQVIYVEDGLLAPLGLALKVLTGKPVAITIHGKDITYDNRLYQFLIPKCLDRLNRVICVSSAIKEACITRRVSGEKTTVVLNGISDDFYVGTGKQSLRTGLADILKKDIGERKILLSVGRLVEKKGIHWFVAEVMPRLADDSFVYIIAGEGFLKPVIRESIKENKLENNVILFGWANDDMLRLLYNVSDIFIMPNVFVADDMEGFGLVALEAASCALPVVASNLEGIKEAVQNGENGILVESGNAQSFIDRVRELLGNNELRERVGTRARKFTLENYGWEKVAQYYLEEFAKLEG